LLKSQICNDGKQNNVFFSVEDSLKKLDHTPTDNISDSFSRKLLEFSLYWADRVDRTWYNVRFV